MKIKTVTVSDESNFAKVTFVDNSTLIVTSNLERRLAALEDLAREAESFLLAYDTPITEAPSKASLRALGAAKARVHKVYAERNPSVHAHPTQGYILTKCDGKRVAFQSRAEADEHLRFELSLGGAL